jgi:hypothetical protein
MSSGWTAERRPHFSKDRTARPHTEREASHRLPSFERPIRDPKGGTKPYLGEARTLGRKRGGPSAWLPMFPPKSTSPMARSHPGTNSRNGGTRKPRPKAIGGGRASQKGETAARLPCNPAGQADSESKSNPNDFKAQGQWRPETHVQVTQARGAVPWKGTAQARRSTRSGPEQCLPYVCFRTRLSRFLLSTLNRPVK